MIEQAADLWTVPADFRVITTNGSVRYDGKAVMGRGCARQAKQQYPPLARQLGQRLREGGNRVHLFPEFKLFTFPVKHEWMLDADMALIAASVVQFSRLLVEGFTYVMPRPGCGNGRLAWAQVRPLLVGLPDTVTVVHFATEAD